MLVRLKRRACGLSVGAVCDVYLLLPGLYEITGVLFGGAIDSTIPWDRMVVQGDFEMLDGPIKKPLGGEGRSASGGRGVGEEKQDNGIT